MDLDEGFDPARIEVFVGVDMAKGDHYAQAITTAGGELFDRPVANDEQAISQLIADAAAHGKAALVVDQPASGAQLLLALARDVGVPVAYVTGLQMRRAADLYAGAAKTDPRDAWVLADYARRNADRLCWLSVTDELLMQLRVLNGRDVDLATDANRLANRARDALVAVSPALERALGDRLGHAGVRDVLGRYPTPTALRAAGRARVQRLVAKRSPRLARKVTDAVFDALDAQSITLPAEDTWGEVIIDLAGDLERTHARRAELAKQIEEVFLQHPLAKVLVSLCGFGPRTGARTLAEIGNPNRFANGGRLAAYAGLAPVDRRSGRTINSATRARTGNHRLKNALFIAAFVTTQPPAPTTCANEPKAKPTTPPSHASPGVAATSSSPCSATNPLRPQPPRPPTNSGLTTRRGPPPSAARPIWGPGCHTGRVCKRDGERIRRGDGRGGAGDRAGPGR